MLNILSFCIGIYLLCILKSNIPCMYYVVCEDKFHCIVLKYLCFFHFTLKEHMHKKICLSFICLLNRKKCNFRNFISFVFLYYQIINLWKIFKIIHFQFHLNEYKIIIRCHFNFIQIILIINRYSIKIRW